MSSASQCPDQDVLRRFVMGQLADPDVQTLEAHVAECEHCVAALCQLQTVDPFESAIRKAGQRGAAASLDDNRLIARIVGTLDSRCQSVATTLSEVGSTPTDLDLSWLSPAETDDELGRFSIFRVLHVIGQGGMGIVFESEDLKLQRRLALKVMLPKAAADPAGSARFLREARAAAKVRHPNVVTIYQADIFGTVPFIAMELLRGESLHERLRRVGPLPLKDVLNLGRQIAAGLSAAHAEGLLHRDIKPANIWLEQSDDGEVIAKVLDFGLARSVEGDGSLTQSGMIVGTPQYMAPEQAKGAPPTVRSDLFSLGCVLYQMTTGRPAFQGRNVLDQLRALAIDEPPPVTDLRDNAPFELSLLIHQLLEKTPIDRPTSAAEVAERLREVASPQVRPLHVDDRTWQKSTIAAIVVFAAAIAAVSTAFRGKHPVTDDTQLAPAKTPWGVRSIANPEPSGSTSREISIGSQGAPQIAASRTGTLSHDAPIKKTYAIPLKVAADSKLPTDGNRIPTSAFLVSKQLTGFQESPAVACGQQTTLVVWQRKELQQTDWDIYGCLIDPNDSVGTPFVINETRAEDQTKPSVTSTGKGSFVVVWESLKQDGSDTGIFARRIGANGQPLGGEFQVNSFTTNNQTTAHIAANQNGEFLVVWGSLYQVQGWDVFGQYFAQDGTKNGEEVRVNEDAKFNQSYPSVAVMADGSAVVAFQRSQGDQALYDIRVQRFSSDRLKSGSEVLANTHTYRIPPWGKALPDIATNGTHRFVVVWQDYHTQSPQDGSEVGVFGQLFDTAGNKVGHEFQANKTTQGVQAEPSVTMLKDGSFIVVWQGNGVGDSSGVFARTFNIDGEPIDDEFRLNDFTDGEQSHPRIATSWDGQSAVAVWRDNGPQETKGVSLKRLHATTR